MKHIVLHNTQVLIENNIDNILLNSYHFKKGTDKPQILPIQSGTEGETYLIQTKMNSFILKIYLPNKLEEIMYENEILKTLNATSKKFITLASDIFFLENNLAVLYQYFDGKSLTKESINPRNISKIAQMQAEMHKALKEFHTTTKERKRFSIFDFTFIDIFQSNRSIETDRLIKKTRDILLKKLSPYHEHPFPKSIIHEDLEMENILQDKNGELIFIDFGESHKAPIISDISTALKELIANPLGLKTKLFILYLKEYQKENHVLDQIQLDIIPSLILRRTLFMFTYLLYRGNTLKNEGNKGYSCNVDIEKKLLENLLQNEDLVFNLNDIN